MASGALFGNSGSRSQSKHLVEFRAGKMNLKGNMVHPDKRKGLVYVYQSDDALMHFCWKDRTKGTVEDDLIIFPDDVEFKHVAQCTTGRVYLLKFKSLPRRFFFWMQEPKTDKDDEYCRKVNDLLNNPPAPGSSRGSGGAGGLSGLPADLASGLGEGDIQNLLGNMSQQQLMQLLGGMGMGGMGGLSSLMGGRSTSAQSESTPPSRVQSSPGPRSGDTSSSSQPRPATAAADLPSTQLLTPQSTTPLDTTQESSSVQAVPASTGTGQSGLQLSDLQNILTNLGGAQGEATQAEAIDLSSALTPESIIPFLANAQIQERLIPFLPEGESLPKSEEELRNTVTSPQFQQAMSSFSAALASGQLGPLIHQFGVGEEAANAAAQGDVDAFARALQGEKKGESEDQEMKEDDEKMTEDEKKEDSKD